MSIPQVTLNGTFTDAAGDPMSGTLSFRLNAPLVDSVGNVVSERVEIVSTLNDDGQITDTDGETVGLVLYCTSGGDIAPAGLVYDVKVEVGSRPHRVSVALPDSLGATVDWADLVPIPASTGVVWTVPDLTAEQARDLVGSTLVAGDGLSKTVDDAGDTVTLDIDTPYTTAEQTKLAGIEDGAQVNEVTAADLTSEATDRANADTALDSRVDSLEATAAALPDTYASVLELTKKAPSGPITFAEASGTAYQPLSVGVDGYVYGCNDTRLVRSNDGFATASIGPKFIDLGGVGSIVFASKLTEGYLVILSTDTTSGKTGEAWFSTSFTTGWAKVADFQSVVGLSISRPVHITAGTVMIVGDYVTNLVNASANLHLTRDGGQTWTTIRTKNQTSTAYNNHWHGSAYDPLVGANGRIWSAGGDGPQDIWSYSDDWGATWTDIPAAGGAGPDEPGVSIYNHPTLIIDLIDRLAVTPDGSASRAGVWTVDKTTGLMAVAHEAAPTWGYGQFARGPYAQSSDQAEVYVLFPPGVTDVTNAVYVSGSGDGGKSWHRLWAAPVTTGTDFYTTGIVGPDSSGRLYVGHKVGSAWHLLVGTKPKWQSTAVGGAPSLRSTVLTGDAYGSTWADNMDPPTKDAVYDKIEGILDGVTFTGDVVVPDEAYDATAWDGSLEVPTKNALRDKIESLSLDGGGSATTADAFRLVAFADVPFAQTNWSSYFQANSQYLAGGISSSGAQNATITFLLPVALTAGTWSFALLHTTGANRGIYTIETSPDNATWTTVTTTVDGYAASGVATRSTVTGVAIPAGTKYVRFTMAAKNGSSSSYLGQINALTGVRTGA